jgi:hypothetical protein
MTSHREAPGIAKDAAADSTDLYAFVSPDKPNTVTLIANYIPLEPRLANAPGPGRRRHILATVMMPAAERATD